MNCVDRWMCGGQSMEEEGGGGGYATSESIYIVEGVILSRRSRNGTGGTVDAVELTVGWKMKVE